MKSDKLFDYIGQIDDNFILEADVPKKDQNKSKTISHVCIKWGKKLSYAAAALIFILTFVFLLKQRVFYYVHENSSEANSQLAQLTENSSIAESDTSSTKTENVKVLFDYFQQYYVNSNVPVDVKLSEFPNVTFRRNLYQFIAIKDNEETVLVYGMPILNVFITDLNGDDKPEFCITSSFGSGISDDRVTVIDYANNAVYSIIDRQVFDYNFANSDGKLLLYKLPYHRSAAEIIVSDKISIQDKQLVVEFSNGETIKIDAVGLNEE